MLIQFSIENFFSFKKKQCLSMLAGRYSELPGNVLTVDVGGQKLRLLRSAVLYGANAAGKSNLIYAMRIMMEIVNYSASPNDEHLMGFLPFLFDDTTSGKPSEFEIIFIANDGVRYQYGFSAKGQRILSERLLAFPQGRQQRWFERHYNFVDDKYEWEFGGNLLGEKDLWRKSTRSAALFLSTAVNLNSEQLKPVADWFADKCCAIWGVGIDPGKSVTVSLIEEGIIEKKSVQQYLNDADLDITDFTIKEKPGGDSGFSFTSYNTNEKQYGITTAHKTSSGTKELPFGMESTGTSRMFALAGPWVLALRRGHVLFADELNVHLHPHLSRHLVGMFHDPDRNKSNAQLIFTTHDTSMLKGNLFRRDQIWFLEKDKTEATTLYSLSDFQSRKNENRESAYLSGHYGGVPGRRWYK